LLAEEENNISAVFIIGIIGGIYLLAKARRVSQALVAERR